MKDHFGHNFSGADAAGLLAFQDAQDELKCFIGDPAASCERALAASPGMTMAHVLKAYLHLLGTEPAGAPVARACCDAAADLPADERERQHLKAARLLAHGHWHEASQLLEDIAVAWPHDLLALQVGHQIDFFTGDSRMLRDRIARALPAWSRDMHGYHALLSMYAFGLEETGDYGRAEKYGRTAVELEPRDGWGWHAVAHVMEMRNQPDKGVQWLQPGSATWSRESFLAVHNWWHLALFQLELGNVDEVLRLYDSAIGGAGSGVTLDMLDASALLWRLQLRGEAVGDRWQALAGRWVQGGVPGLYAFNDMHAMMAHVGAGNGHEQEVILEAQAAAMERDDDNAGFTRDTGYAAVRAIQAFGAGDYGRAIDLLRRIRSRAARFGGSHAQRDVIDLTLIEAARRSGNPSLARALVHERSCLRPRSALEAGAVRLAA